MSDTPQVLLAPAAHDNDGLRTLHSSGQNQRSIGFIRRNQSAAQLSSSMALDRLLPPALTTYGLQSIIQHIAHFPMGSGTAC